MTLTELVHHLLYLTHPLVGDYSIHYCTFVGHIMHVRMYVKCEHIIALVCVCVCVNEWVLVAMIACTSSPMYDPALSDLK